MVGQLPLEQHIGVRIPGGQPNLIDKLKTISRGHFRLRWCELALRGDWPEEEREGFLCWMEHVARGRGWRSRRQRRGVPGKSRASGNEAVTGRLRTTLDEWMLILKDFATEGWTFLDLA